MWELYPLAEGQSMFIKYTIDSDPHHPWEFEFKVGAESAEAAQFTALFHAACLLHQRGVAQPFFQTKE